MITVTLENDEALDMLMDRLSVWTDDRDVQNLYAQMYESYIDGGCFDGGSFNVMEIVDNDYVNYCSTIYKEECSEEDWNKLVELYNDGERDISCEEFEGDEICGSFIEAMNAKRTMALMRY